MPAERKPIQASPRGWRQKWRRAPPQRRALAAASLVDIFPRSRLSRLLPAVLLGSLGVHLCAAPFVSFGERKDVRELATTDTYLRKVVQKERARWIARKIAGRVAMPPAPPDPEAVVEQAMAEALTSDVEKVTAGLLNVKLQKELSAYVESSLKDELAAAARDIATGRLTEDQIKALHRKFQERAHHQALAWRKDYLVRHQEERAAMSTTEWYEKDVSPTLFDNLTYHVLVDGSRWPPNAQIWSRAYTGTYGWGRWPNWSDLRSARLLARKIARLKPMLTGKWRNAGGRGKDQHPGWPGPGAEQARIIDETLKSVYTGTYSQTYPRPAWRDVAYGSKDTPRMTFGLLTEFYPHRPEEMRPRVEKVDRLWTQTLAAAEGYRRLAEGASDPAGLKQAHAPCMGLLKQLLAGMAGLTPPDPGARRAVNWAIRLDILTGPAREKMYDAWVDGLVDGLSPLIRDFARSQFKKGILVHTGGVKQAMKEFPTKVVPLLRRDVKRMLTRRKFHDRIHYTVYPFKGYRSKVTNKRRLPERKDAVGELVAAEKVVAGWPESERAYAAERRKLLNRDFATAVKDTREAVLELVFTGNLLFSKMGAFLEGVDYADRVQEKLDARAMALKGRGQDLAKLTADGVPDTSAPLVALMLGASRGHGSSLEPVLAGMLGPQGRPEPHLRAALTAAEAAWPKPPGSWGLRTQAEVTPKFRTVRFEAIPFLARFPRLDGDLRDWGAIRPLIVRTRRGGRPVLVYAAWNYQGFFFGYEVTQHPDEFYWPSLYRVAFSLHSYVLGAGMATNTGVGWAYGGDYFRLLFDTLDARSETRGEPHTQEFVIFPRGTENTPNLPGIERVIESKRDAKAKQYRRVKSACKVFGQQPPPSHGPDGAGPYRATRSGPDGYSVEVFLPRSLFNTPVFCPGWHIGFDCTVATGHQRRNARPPNWAAAHQNYADHPDRWGDLLLLGTDPRMIVQEAGGAWPVARAIVPGHWYLVTIIDPDRNIRPTAADTVLVSAEVVEGTGSATRSADVEVYVLTESKPNSGVFRGFVRTQPGRGREVQGVLEVMGLREVSFGYVDVGDSKGRRNVVRRLRLPVVAGVLMCRQPQHGEWTR